MKTFILTLPAFALLAACGSNTATNTVTTDTGTTTEISTGTGNDRDGLANASVATPAMTGQQFADTAASSDAYEIEAGKMAKEKATSKDLKDFGAMMVSHHSESTAKLKAAGGRASPAIVPNATLSPKQQQDLDALRAASGAEFDRLYRTQQIMAHQQALAGLEGYQAGGDVNELKAWAAETAPTVRAHLDRIQAIQ